jgi:hypothetical protein
MTLHYYTECDTCGTTDSLEPAKDFEPDDAVMGIGTHVCAECRKSREGDSS